MDAIAVSSFRNYIISGDKRFPRVNKRRRRVSKISGESYCFPFSANVNRARSQYMPRIPELRFQISNDYPLAIRNLPPQLHKLHNVIHVIKRRFVVSLGLDPKDMLRIRKEKLRKVFCGGRPKNCAAEAVAVKFWKAADVINVGVRYKDRINGFRVVEKRLEVVRFAIARSLMQSAIHKNPRFFGLQKIIRPRHAPCPAEETKSHERIIPKKDRGVIIAHAIPDGLPFSNSRELENKKKEMARQKSRLGL